MEINFTANLSPTDVERIIMESLEKSMPTHKVRSISFKIGEVGDERFGSSKGFIGADVVMEPRVVAPQRSERGY